MAVEQVFTWLAILIWVGLGAVIVLCHDRMAELGIETEGGA